MAKFNSPSENTIKTVNRCGHAAYAMKDKELLVTQVLTSFFNEKKFYGDNSSEIEETVDRVIKDDPEFVWKLAVFARREFNMRSIAHVLVAHLAHEVEGKPFVESAVKGVTLRGDDVTEIMAYYISKYGKPIPNSLKKGVAKAIQGFDEYTLAKYKGGNKSVRMKDLLCLCHPKPLTKAQADLFKRCLEDKLEIPVTWETELSANGNNTETWGKLIASGKVGYMAMLRNLRNILKANPENIDEVYKLLSNPDAVRKSKQLPFRFLSAYRVMKELGEEMPVSNRVYDVLEDAIDASIDNLPRIPGKTVIAIDTSGSMAWSDISDNSGIRPVDIAVLLGMIANRICDEAIVFTFDNIIGTIPVSHRDGILSTVTNYRPRGGGTDMTLPFKEMIKRAIQADRVIILSDNECNSQWRWSQPVQILADEYRRQTGNNIWVHAIDLEGYGTQQFHGSKTNVIAGWSEKVFEFILLAEQGIGSLTERIQNYTWTDKRLS